ncbi:MAG: GNAT family N-acetyltransferase [Candidatus Heimdallarchaeota archaeon]|nr:GNAT family N-acetyltransferase [Candidatus Heimdallarchaeota archaeon]
MEKIEIIEIDGQNDEAIEMAFYAFYPSPGDVDTIKKMKPYFKDDTSLILYEDDKPVSAIICKPIPQNVRGIIIPMCGLQNVATDPEARRKGYSKKLMHKSFEHMKKKDYVFSTLYPFKESYYEGFGYISFPQVKTAIFSPKQITGLLKEDLPGEVERLSFADGFEIYEKFLKEVQNSLHGMGMKHTTEIIRYKENSKEWVAIAKSENRIVGVMTYRITGFWKEIKVRDFFYSNSLGKFLLLQFLAIHADQVNEIHLINIKPDESPETWINDTFWGEKGKIISREWVPSCMGRIIQVGKMSGMQVGEGEISVKVTDEYCEWNNRTFNFKSNDGILEVTEKEETDCELSIQGLSALIYGCYTLDDFEFKGWGNLSLEHKIKLIKLFPKLKPFLHADF